MPIDMVTKLCQDFYTVDDIDVAKVLIYNECEARGITNLPRMIKRRGDTKKTKDLSDIIQLIMECETGELPIFVAARLRNLPPLTYNNFDFSRILTDIEMLKNEMAIFKAMEKSQQDIIDAVNSLKGRNITSTIPSNTPELSSKYTSTISGNSTATDTSTSVAALTDVPTEQLQVDNDATFAKIVTAPPVPVTSMYVNISILDAL